MREEIEVILEREEPTNKHPLVAIKPTHPMRVVVMMMTVVMGCGCRRGGREKWRVAASGSGDRVDPLMRITFGVRRKNPPEKYSGGGGVVVAGGGWWPALGKEREEEDDGVIMDTTKAQQKALDDALVAPENRLMIRKCNQRLSSTLKSNEPTIQVALDALKATHSLLQCI
ncbi:hypothetical protein Tco_0364346 [Tanacetum coccineum]